MRSIYEQLNYMLGENPPYSPKGGPKVYWRFTMDTLISDIDVVIVGQDPGSRRQSCGLAFSYPRGHIFENSAVSKILAEVARCGFAIPQQGGDLSPWSANGVLLMNASLTKVRGNRNVHRNMWERLTDVIIEFIARNNSGVVFMLWGKRAQRKQEAIETGLSERDDGDDDDEAHLILTCQHPCNRPQSDFHGCDHFAAAQRYQESIGKEPTNWNLTYY